MITPKENQYFFANNITGDLVAGKQQVDINWRAGILVMDEPTFAGGEDKGPDPFTAVIAGLIGCTLTTLRMYIGRKGWDITDIHVSANLVIREEPEQSQVFRTLTFSQPVSEEQYEKLLHIAKNCPVARLLHAGLELHTILNNPHADAQTSSETAE